MDASVALSRAGMPAQPERFSSERRATGGIMNGSVM
jgi:hypothetical protein